MPLTPDMSSVQREVNSHSTRLSEAERNVASVLTELKKIAQRLQYLDDNKAGNASGSIKREMLALGVNLDQLMARDLKVLDKAANFDSTNVEDALAELFPGGGAGTVPDSRTITAGAGLTGGGDLTANRTLDVGAGLGITVNANDVQIKNAANLTDQKLTKWDDGNGQLADSLVSESGTQVTVGGSLKIDTIATSTSPTYLLAPISNVVQQITMPTLSVAMRRTITIVSSYPYTCLTTDDVVVCE